MVNYSLRIYFDKSGLIAEFEPFASSPPEDSFFYIRYPKTDVIFGKTKFASDLPTENKQQAEFSTAEFKETKTKDWSKHTKPCQDVMHSFGPINTAAKSPNVKPKPAGVDDGFKGEGAACGSSVLKVAHQMIQSKSSRGFTVASPDDSAPELSDKLRQKLMTRRNSKSLPATPAHSPPGSPNSRRKNTNRFFTSPYEPVEEFGSRSWLTMALLGYRKDLTTSTSTLAEEDFENRLQAGSLAESVENLGPSPKMEPAFTPEQPKHKPPTYKPKPSELREMNFWSPTSM
ncbi:uncharacterized protein LOC121733541 isoform X2 [Aricia agestis]|uniref:uncharacterized protein LOC121733541 isoform X2 n=1 Tax=Aricia agestis TaxID=91739 RepID=UPI001C2065ED|nr:uncharacterized protein LOC121733541 isoform X2 [Aricia agestis]